MNMKAVVPSQLELGAIKNSSGSLKDNIMKFMHQRKSSLGQSDGVLASQV